jgi:hypothetical protein
MASRLLARRSEPVDEIDSVGRVASPEEVHSSVVAQLRSRRAEIEEVIIARIRNVASDAVGSGDVQYEEGQHKAVVAVLDYALTGIEHGEEKARLIPSEAVAQARRAARRGVGLDTVLRRYIAGHAVLADFVVQETDRSGLLGHGSVLRRVQATQAWLLDHLFVSINDEYAREVQRTSRSPEQRRAERVRRLLAGGLVNADELGYEMDAWHLGMIGTGLGVGQAIRAEVGGLDCELLCVSHDEKSVWAWLSGQRNAVAGVIERLRSARWPAGMTLAVGEPWEGVEGWRWTHQEAQAAMMVARHKPQGVTRCADVLLEVAMFRDDMLARTLKDVYLSPLDDLRIGGQVARQTLRAYFAAGRSAGEAADRLKVDRRTVWYRLDKITEGLGWSPEERGTELEVALRLETLDEAIHETGQADPRS